MIHEGLLCDAADDLCGFACSKVPAVAVSRDRSRALVPERWPVLACAVPEAAALRKLF